jgi:hypothetical protein
MRILQEANEIQIEAALREPTARDGIRRTNSGSWAAIRDGRLVNEFRGSGSKAAAIRAAGTNRVIA